MYVCPHLVYQAARFFVFLLFLFLVKVFLSLQKTDLLHLLDVKETEVLAEDSKLHKKAVGLSYSCKKIVCNQEWKSQS